MKPKVFKIAGAWVWQCDHDGFVGDEFHADQWRDPWSACLATAQKHASLQHNHHPGQEILPGMGWA